MAFTSVVVIDKTTGERIRGISLSIRLESIVLSPNEILSWRADFRSTYPDFNWRDRIIHRGNATAYVQCTKDCKNTVDHIDVQIEGSSPTDVGALIEKVHILLGGSLMRHDPLAEQWHRFVAWAKAAVRY